MALILDYGDVPFRSVENISPGCAEAGPPGCRTSRNVPSVQLPRMGGTTDGREWSLPWNDRSRNDLLNVTKAEAFGPGGCEGGPAHVSGGQAALGPSRLRGSQPPTLIPDITSAAGFDAVRLHPELLPPDPVAIIFTTPDTPTGPVTI